MNAIPNVALVDGPKAEAFMTGAKSAAWRKGFLGDPAKFADDLVVHQTINAVHAAVANNVEKIGQLTNDQTRTEPQLHEAAKQLADRTNAVLADAQERLKSRAAEYDGRFTAILAERFVLDERRSPIHAEYAAWLRDKAKDSDGGYTEIRKAALEDAEVASVIYNWPPRLLNLPEKFHTDLGEKITSRWAPDALAAAEMAVELRKLAKGYTPIMTKVQQSFYSTNAASKMASRVEI